MHGKMYRDRNERSSAMCDRSPAMPADPAANYASSRVRSCIIATVIENLENVFNQKSPYA
jgi:hypothetical protein